MDTEGRVVDLPIDAKLMVSYMEQEVTNFNSFVQEHEKCMARLQQEHMRQRKIKEQRLQVIQRQLQQGGESIRSRLAQVQNALGSPATCVICDRVCPVMEDGQDPLFRFEHDGVCQCRGIAVCRDRCLYKMLKLARVVNHELYDKEHLMQLQCPQCKRVVFYDMDVVYADLSASSNWRIVDHETQDEHTLFCIYDPSEEDDLPMIECDEDDDDEDDEDDEDDDEDDNEHDGSSAA